ncbi:MAG: lysophospholipase [Pseudomonadota bacterium]
MSAFTEGSLSSGLYHASWMPDSSTDEHVVIVHGLAEHIGRYPHVAARLNAAGFAVHGLDHIGHGRSPGIRNLVDSFSDFTDGVSELLDMLLATHGANRVHLLGHSMGGLIAATCAVQMPERLKTLMLSGPAIIADPPPPFLQVFLGRVFSKIAPKVGVLALDANGISRDSRVVTAYLEDPLVYNGKITARLAAELLDAMEAIQKRAADLRLPMLLMHGMADTLTAPSGSELLHKRSSSDDKTLKQYPGLYHEIFNEPEQDQVLDDLVSWLQARV